MDTVKQHALDHSMKNIVNNMNAESVVDELIPILTNEENSNIRAETTTHRKNRTLITILKRKGEQQEPFERLLRALSSESVGQGWLADIIQAHHKFLMVPDITMDEFDKIIDKHMDDLIKETEQVWKDNNLQYKFLKEEINNIKVQKTTIAERRGRLLVILLKKGEIAFNYFVEALKKQIQKHIPYKTSYEKAIKGITENRSTSSSPLSDATLAWVYD